MKHRVIQIVAAFSKQAEAEEEIIIANFHLLFGSFCRVTQADDSRGVVLNELFLFPLGKEMFWKEPVYFFFVLEIENEADSEAKSTPRIKWVIN